METVKYLLISFLIYLYINSPQFTFMGGIGFIKVLYLLPLISIIFFNRKYIAYISDFKNEFCIFLLLLLYVLFRTVIGGESIFLWNQFSSIFEYFLIPISLTMILEKYFEFKYNTFVTILLIVSIIGGVISTAALLFPNFGIYLSSNLQMPRDGTNGELIRRGYGLATGLFFGYSIAQALILSIGLNDIKTNKWYLFVLIFVLASIAINARTGLLIVLMLLPLSIIIKRDMTLLLYLSLGIVIAILIFKTVTSIYEIRTDTIDFALSFFDELESMESNDHSSRDTSVDVLLDSMIFLPKTIDVWIFGGGSDLFFDRYKSSDSGFINQLFYGGIPYISLHVYFIILCYKRLKRYNYPFYPQALFIVFIISNLKGLFFYSNAFRLFMLIYIYLVSLRLRNKPIVSNKYS